MRILLTADTVGGVWTYAQELAAGLVRRGVEVTLVSFGEMPAPSQTRWTEGLHGFDFQADTHFAWSGCRMPLPITKNRLSTC